MRKDKTLKKDILRLKHKPAVLKVTSSDRYQEQIQRRSEVTMTLTRNNYSLTGLPYSGKKSNKKN